MPVRTLSPHRIRFIALQIRNGHTDSLAGGLAQPQPARPEVAPPVDPAIRAMDVAASKAKTKALLDRVRARRLVKETIGR